MFISFRKQSIFSSNGSFNTYALFDRGISYGSQLWVININYQEKWDQRIQSQQLKNLDKQGLDNQGLDVVWYRFNLWLNNTLNRWGKELHGADFRLLHAQFYSATPIMSQLFSKKIKESFLQNKLHLLIHYCLLHFCSHHQQANNNNNNNNNNHQGRLWAFSKLFYCQELYL